MCKDQKKRLIDSIASNCGAAKQKSVIPTGASRRIFFSFAPAKESACAAEESFFDLSRSQLESEHKPNPVGGCPKLAF
jgi:hypothetical protein